MLRERSVLAALSVFHERTGDVFRIGLPGFRPVLLVGPEAARFVLVAGRDDFRWRTEGDPVTRLLRQGVLVVDGDPHDRLRQQMTPALHRQMLNSYAGAMLRCTDQILDTWQDGQTRDMLVEMRKIALLILTETLFRVDFTPELTRLWNTILGTIKYISPGLWILWRRIPRPGYEAALQAMDAYLYRIIRERRTQEAQQPSDNADLLGLLLSAGLDDDLIRDQLLTMLIAGHDTSTALLAWALYLLGRHPAAMDTLRAEVDDVIGSSTPGIEHVGHLRYTGNVIDEALRLYPPIHLGSRTAAVDIDYNGYRIPAGTRVIYSIYLTQRHKGYWENPAAFAPERFDQAKRPEPYTFLPFGGGPRNCIGAQFGQVESKLVLARIFQRFTLTLTGTPVHAHMGATLEPRPGVLMQLRRRAATPAP